MRTINTKMYECKIVKKEKNEQDNYYVHPKENILIKSTFENIESGQKEIVEFELDTIFLSQILFKIDQLSDTTKEEIKCFKKYLESNNHMEFGSKEEYEKFEKNIKEILYD